MQKICHAVPPRSKNPHTNHRNQFISQSTINLSSRPQDLAHPPLSTPDEGKNRIHFKHSAPPDALTVEAVNQRLKTGHAPLESRTPAGSWALLEIQKNRKD